MSEDRGPRHWQPMHRGLGRLCPTCGAPLRDGTAACSACGADSAATEAQWGLMTPFGHGLCAFMGAVLLGASISAALVDQIPRQAVVLGPLVLAVLAAWLGSQLGRRLAPQWRCSYEHLLVGAMTGGAAVAFLAVLGWRSVEGVLLVWTGTAALVYALMRRYGYRAESLR